jgi:CysZ protein
VNFFRHLIIGFKNYVKGVQFLIEHKLWWFIFFPILLFFGIYWLGYYFESLEYSVKNDLKNHGADIESLNGLIWMTIKMLFFDGLYIIFTKFTMYLVVIILSPALSILSEKIEQIITGNKYPFNFWQLLSDIKRGIRIALRNIFWEYFFIVIVLGIASFMGGTAKSILIFIIPVMIGFYFYGFAFMDYVNERRRLNIQQSIYFVSKHRGLAVAIGSIYSIFFLSFFYVFRGFSSFATDTSTQLFWGTVLGITFLLAAIAPILAITSATLSVHELVDLGKNEYAMKEGILGEKSNADDDVPDEDKAIEGDRQKQIEPPDLEEDSEND